MAPRFKSTTAAWKDPNYVKPAAKPVRVISPAQAKLDRQFWADIRAEQQRKTAETEAAWDIRHGIRPKHDINAKRAKP